MSKRKCRSKIICAKAFPGGIGKNVCPEDVNQKELKMGIKVEFEHTTSKRRACAIALDHLEEDQHYYSKLKKAKL